MQVTRQTVTTLFPDCHGSQVKKVTHGIKHWWHANGLATIADLCEFAVCRGKALVACSCRQGVLVVSDLAGDRAL